MKKIYICLVVFFIGLNVLAGIWCINNNENKKNSERWPTTTASVKSTRLVELTGTRGPNLFCTELTYDYVVNQTKFTSFGTLKCLRNKNLVIQELATYKERTLVTVFYNPIDPSWGWLTPPHSSDIYWTLLLISDVCLIFLFFGLKFLAASLKDEGKRV